MVISFLNLPLEIRLLIYKYRLVAIRIVPLSQCTQENCKIDLSRSKKLAMDKAKMKHFIVQFRHIHQKNPGIPAILSTCSQIYHEAVPLLYKDSRFCFDTNRQSCIGFRRPPFPIEGIRHVENLDISVGLEQWVMDIPSTDASEIIHSLLSQASSLKRLAFGLYAFIDAANGDYDDWKRRVLIDSKISDWILASQSLQEVWITHTHEDPADGMEDPPEYFQDIARSKGWIFEEVIHPDEDPGEPPWSSEGFYRWDWHIRPAPEGLSDRPTLSNPSVIQTAAWAMREPKELFFHLNRVPGSSLVLPNKGLISKSFEKYIAARLPSAIHRTTDYISDRFLD